MTKSARLKVRLSTTNHQQSTELISNKEQEILNIEGKELISKIGYKATNYQPSTTN